MYFNAIIDWIVSLKQSEKYQSVNADLYRKTKAPVSKMVLFYFFLRNTILAELRAFSFTCEQ